MWVMIMGCFKEHDGLSDAIKYGKLLSKGTNINI